MDMDHRVCDRARRSRDARFDGRFFIAVTTTGVYCRPICPARTPKDENVRYFATAAAAEAAGFRPCLRCRPEASPGTPAWSGTSGIVSRALRLIDDGALRGANWDRAKTATTTNGGDDIDALADRLGITARHLRRLFLQHLGATPLEVALTRRVHFAKKLLDETTVPMHQVAAAAGFGSIRRFNSVIRRTYARTPTAIRRLAGGRGAADARRYEFRLAYRPPYDWAAMLAFLAARATPGVEWVGAGRYRRTIEVSGVGGAIEVSQNADASALRVAVTFPDPRGLLSIVERVRRQFDLFADPSVISAQLGRDPLLRGATRRHDGLRMPGAWDPFELAVRAILGQQISVAAATTIAGRIASTYGACAAMAPTEGLTRMFPTPSALRDARLEACGVMPSRADTIRRLSAAVADRKLSLSAIDAGGVRAALLAIPGVGPWTAEYVAMRAFGEPDAFPSADLVLRRMAGDCTQRALERRADAWRPWRAYAVMLLWQAASDGQAPSPPRRPDDDRARLGHARLRTGAGAVAAAVGAR